ELAVRLEARRADVPSQAMRILRQYHQAYRDLSAVLATVRSEDLDRAPQLGMPQSTSVAGAEGEWPVRDVPNHMLGPRYGFLSVCLVALARHRAGNATEPTDEEWNEARAPIARKRELAMAPMEHASVDDIQGAFATIHELNMRELGVIADAELVLPAWFW